MNDSQIIRKKKVGENKKTVCIEMGKGKGRISEESGLLGGREGGNGGGHSQY